MNIIVDTWHPPIKIPPLPLSLTTATAIMREAVRKWPQLNGSLVALANETQLVNTLMNMSDQNPSGVCQPNGRAGGNIYTHIFAMNNNTKFGFCFTQSWVLLLLLFATYSYVYAQSVPLFAVCSAWMCSFVNDAQLVSAMFISHPLWIFNGFPLVFPHYMYTYAQLYGSRGNCCLRNVVT